MATSILAFTETIVRMQHQRTKTAAIVLSCVAIAALSGCASKPKRGPVVPPQQAAGLDGSSYIAEQTRTTEPFSHVLFCKSYPSECAGTGGPMTVELTSAKQAELASVNRSVNAQITPRNDRSGDDVWTLSPRSGDCEDYAVTKRHILISRGWPSSALRLAIGYTRSGEGHLVLAVRTSDGDMILDNETNAIRNWQHAGLNWQEIQSSQSPRVWYKI